MNVKMEGRDIQVDVHGVKVNCISWDHVLSTIELWCSSRDSRSVCLCNVHSVVTARSDPMFKGVLNCADLALPDGAPIAWFMRRQGCVGQERIGGPDLMARCCALAAEHDYGVFLYGSTVETLDCLRRALEAQYPGLKVVGVQSPPFRELSDEELEADVQKINRSGAQMLFVALGCPKQEKLIGKLKGRVNAVMFGFGAAFDFHSGQVPRAPAWMMRAGLEWLHRLAMDPRRLWKRYLVTNSVFILLTMKSMLVSVVTRGRKGA